MNKVVFRNIIFCLILLIAAGCEQSGKTPEDTSGSSIKIGIMGSPKTLNPLIAQEQNAVEIRDILFRSIFDWDDKWNRFPQLALRIPTTENGDIIKSAPGVLSMNFSISPDARWSDGLYVSGGDFVFASQVSSYPAIDSRNTWWTSGISKLQSPSEYRLEFSANMTDFAFVPNFKPLPHYAMEDGFSGKVGSYLFSPSRLANISCGPYMLKNVVMSKENISQVVLTRNPEYTKKRPDIYSMEFSYYPAESFEAALFSGSFDFVPRLTLEQAKILESNDKFNVHYYENTWLHVLFINMSTLTDLNLRKALFSMLDRKSIAVSLYGDKASVAGNYVNKRDAAYLPVFEQPPEMNVNSAEKYLQLAGYKRQPDNSWSKDGKPLTFKIACRNDSINKAIFKNISGQLNKFGIKTENVSFEKSRKTALWPDLVIDVVNTAPWADHLSAFYSASPKVSAAFPKRKPSWSLWKSAENDSIYLSYISTFDDNERRELLKKHQQLVSRELPVIPLFFDIESCAAKKGLENVLPRGFGSNMWNVENWTLGK